MPFREMSNARFCDKRRANASYERKRVDFTNQVDWCDVHCNHNSYNINFIRIKINNSYNILSPIVEWSNKTRITENKHFDSYTIFIIFRFELRIWSFIKTTNCKWYTFFKYQKQKILRLCRKIKKYIVHDYYKIPILRYFRGIAHS